MAVAYKIKFAGGTLDQYDRVMELMGLDHHERVPDGAIFHWVTLRDDGLMVVDVWESDEQFEKFAKEEIKPYTQQVGLSEPSITRFEVHNMLGAPAATTV